MIRILQNLCNDWVNINGPSVIAVPDWVENRLGAYYLYFAHHKGNYIRMAHADSPAGPWQLYEPGTLRLEASGFAANPAPGSDGGLTALWRTFALPVVRDYLILLYRAAVSDQRLRRELGIDPAENSRPYIASPEVIVDHRERRFLMYFHGLGNEGYQHSRLAVSQDGVLFEHSNTEVFSTYLRAFEYQGMHYLLGMPGILYRSSEPDGGFTPRDKGLFDPDMRHVGVWVEGESLQEKEAHLREEDDRPHMPE
jgi:hypothetical protein